MKVRILSWVPSWKFSLWVCQAFVRQTLLIDADVAKMVYAAASKPVVFGRGGSSPSIGTRLIIDKQELRLFYLKQKNYDTI